MLFWHRGCIAYVYYFQIVLCIFLNPITDMEFLEVLTEGLERVLMVRGGGREVITIYSWASRSHLTSSMPRLYSTTIVPLLSIIKKCIVDLIRVIFQTNVNQTRHVPTRCYPIFSPRALECIRVSSVFVLGSYLISDPVLYSQKAKFPNFQQLLFDLSVKFRKLILPKCCPCLVKTVLSVT